MQAGAGGLGPPCSAPHPRGVGRRSSGSRTVGWKAREAALPPGQGTAPTCGAPAFSRRCLGRLASSLRAPGRGQARTEGARRRSACDSSFYTMSPLWSSPPARTGFGVGGCGRGGRTTAATRKFVLGIKLPVCSCRSGAQESSVVPLNFTALKTRSAL